MQTAIQGPYDLARQSEFFGEWTKSRGDSIVMAFPVEGWTESAAVQLRQHGDKIEGAVYGTAEPAWRQALAVLSLDEDGSGYAAVGESDPVIGRLQREHGFPRPVLFHSPYEAACAFIIGHRLRMTQQRAIRARLARDSGEHFEVDGTTVHAFPGPRRLLELTEIPGVNDEKVHRLHGIAQAALDGLLDRDRLRALPVADALAQVRQLRGVGEFFAMAIVLRGAGRTDAAPGDELTLAGIDRLYGPGADAGKVQQGWRPYRRWCSVLVHAAERRARA
jgi:DNA-3-methyladenine glycosylase II